MQMGLLCGFVSTGAVLGQDTPPQPAASPAPRTFQQRLNIRPIGPNLLRGALPADADFARLAGDLKVERVVSLLSDTEQPETEKPAVQAAGMEFIHVPVIRKVKVAPSKLHLDIDAVRRLVADIKKSGKKTYVHCQKGRDRSGCVDFAYRVLVDGWSVPQAELELVNRGFMASRLPGLVEDLKLLASGLDELPVVAIKPRPTEEKGRTVSVDGIDVYVTTMGSGPPLYLVHGGPGENHLTFRPYLDDLADQFTLVYYDQRGCGRSGKPPFDAMYTLDAVVGEIEGLRKALGHDKISLLGQSTGGIMAMRYAMDHRDRVDKLVLVDTWASAAEYRKYGDVGRRLLSLPDERVFEQVVRRAARRGRDLNDQELEALLKLFYPYNFFGRLTPEGLEAWNQGTTVSAQVYYASADELLNKLDLRDRLGSLAGVPTLVVGGAFDTIGSPPALKTIADGIGDTANLVMFKRSGHFPYVEEHDAFIKTVRDFLAGG